MDDVTGAGGADVRLSGQDGDCLKPMPGHRRRIARDLAGDDEGFENSATVPLTDTGGATSQPLLSSFGSTPGTGLPGQGRAGYFRTSSALLERSDDRS
jgi:hypothetical protein